MDTTSTITIGVISGVLTSGVVFLFLKLYESVIAPWYQGFIYRGVNVSGTWHCRRSDMDQEIILELKQHGHAISGIANFVRRVPFKVGEPEQFEPLRSFTVQGSIQDRFVNLTLRHTDSQRLGVNTYLLEVKGDGRRLDGQFTYYSVTSGRVGASQQSLFRDRDLAIAPPMREKTQREKVEKTVVQPGFANTPED